MTLIAALALVVTYELPVDPARLDEFLSWIETGIEVSRSAPGNLRFDVYVDPDRPGQVLFVERWESEEAQQRYTHWRPERGELQRLSGFLVGPMVKRSWRDALQPDERAVPSADAVP